MATPPPPPCAPTVTGVPEALRSASLTQEVANKTPTVQKVLEGRPGDSELLQTTGHEHPPASKSISLAFATNKLSRDRWEQLVSPDQWTNGAPMDSLKWSFVGGGVPPMLAGRLVSRAGCVPRATGWGGAPSRSSQQQ